MSSNFQNSFASEFPNRTGMGSFTKDVHKREGRGKPHEDKSGQGGEVGPCSRLQSLDNKDFNNIKPITLMQ